MQAYSPYSNKPVDLPPPQPVFNKPRSHKKAIISTLLLFLTAPLIALFLTFFVIRSYEVDGPSMEQTLQNSDLLIVNKLPRTWAKITGNSYVPGRYEIVIFSRPETDYSGVSENKQLVKRVIALPGERVVIKNGVITVFNNEEPAGFNPDKDQEYSRTITSTPGNVDITLNEDEIFVSGDNRDNSLDSRYFGPVKLDQVVGNLSVRIFPINKMKAF